MDRAAAQQQGMAEAAAAGAAATADADAAHFHRVKTIDFKGRRVPILLQVGCQSMRGSRLVAPICCVHAA